MTSVTASPLEPDDMNDTSVELKLPPPTSSSSSDRTFQPEPSANDDIQQLESSATGTEVQDFGSKITPSNVERVTVDDNSHLEGISAPSMVSESQRLFSQLGRRFGSLAWCHALLKPLSKCKIAMLTPPIP